MATLMPVSGLLLCFAAAVNCALTCSYSPFSSLVMVSSLPAHMSAQILPNLVQKSSDLDLLKVWGYYCFRTAFFPFSSQLASVFVPILATHTSPNSICCRCSMDSITLTTSFGALACRARHWTSSSLSTKSFWSRRLGFRRYPACSKSFSIMFLTTMLQECYVLHAL
jgi:hypothetical protein